MEDYIKRDIIKLLKKLIPTPNKDILSIQANYDPNLQSLTIQKCNINDESIIILDEIVEEN